MRIQDLAVLLQQTETRELVVLLQPAENTGTCGSVTTSREYRNLWFCYNQMRIRELVVLLKPAEKKGTCGSVRRS